MHLTVYLRVSDEARDVVLCPLAYGFGTSPRP
jgi:hypothetical protein